ncbi:hypothetical protein B0H13DRAFT_1930576 [Mycena leptocephala]|nr:hypothetical protein B0H13DRAFT_1930576 [Mycena leptocephala]
MQKAFQHDPSSPFDGLPDVPEDLESFLVYLGAVISSHDQGYLRAYAWFDPVYRPLAKACIKAMEPEVKRMTESRKLKKPKKTRGVLRRDMANVPSTIESRKTPYDRPSKGKENATSAGNGGKKAGHLISTAKGDKGDAGSTATTGPSRQRGEVAAEPLLPDCSTKNYHGVILVKVDSGVARCTWSSGQSKAMTYARPSPLALAPGPPPPKSEVCFPRRRGRAVPPCAPSTELSKKSESAESSLPSSEGATRRPLDFQWVVEVGEVDKVWLLEAGAVVESIAFWRALGIGNTIFERQADLPPLPRAQAGIHVGEEARERRPARSCFPFPLSALWKCSSSGSSIVGRARRMSFRPRIPPHPSASSTSHDCGNVGVYLRLDSVLAVRSRYNGRFDEGSNWKCGWQTHDHARMLKFRGLRPPLPWLLRGCMFLRVFTRARVRLWCCLVFLVGLEAVEAFTQPGEGRCGSVVLGVGFGGGNRVDTEEVEVDEDEVYGGVHGGLALEDGRRELLWFIVVKKGIKDRGEGVEGMKTKQ